MIPDEAVHAGLIELYERPHVEGVSAADIRRVLRAAAPHLMAQAWDEGHEDGFWHLVSHAEGKARNPYRKAEL